MFALRRSMTLVFVLLIALMPGLAAWPSAPAAGDCAGGHCRAWPYVYQADTTAAGSFKTLLNLRGYDVDLVTLGTVANFDFSADQAIIIADDTAGPNGWDVQLAGILIGLNKYTIGLGDGGAAFFDVSQLSIGKSNAQPGSDPDATAVNPGDAVWSTPNPIALPADAHASAVLA